MQFPHSFSTMILATLVALSSQGVAHSQEVAEREQAGLPPGIENTQRPQDVPLSPRESLQKITVPDGFHVTLFAGEPNVQQPIAFTFDDRGRLWIAENYSHPKWKETGRDRIVILEDVDQDGQFDKRTVFIDNLNYLSAIELGHGGVWVGNTPHLLFIPDRNRDDQPDGKPIPLLDGFVRRNPNNVLNNFRWGPDGWLYGSIGEASASFVGPPGTPPEQRLKISRGIWRFHPIDQRFEVVARGAVNPWGLDFNEVGQGFFVNCVLAHLWHLVPGARYERRPGETDHPFIYSRIKPCCDHLHWGGGDWTSSRGGKGEHNTAGGGHAHTGAMIYLGDNWPARYRNTIFMGNIHGNRINNDLLVRAGSGYVGKHAPDFLHGNNPWFRSLSQKYGPDGGVFLTDWHDLGECHDSDGSHRSSGRIYKVVYGTPKKLEAFDLQTLTDDQLVDLQLHANEWYARHARRILHERDVDDKDALHAKLRKLFTREDHLPHRLRALWTLHATGGASQDFLCQQLEDDSEHVRCWAVRLLADAVQVKPTTLAKLQEQAAEESSALVRLYLAAALQRVPLEAKWDLASALLAHAEDAEDANIPHMLWYGIEPLVTADRARALGLIRNCRIPLVRRHLARRVSEGK